MICIAGSSGFIGTNATQYFLDKGYEVLGLDLMKPKKEFGKGFRYQTCDLADYKNVDSCFAKYKPQEIINLAFVTRSTHVSRELHIDFNITFNVLEACLHHNVEKLIHMSSSQVYGNILRDVPISEDNVKLNPKRVYGKAKLMSEMMVKAYIEAESLPAIIVRGFEVYGPYLTIPSIVRIFIERALNGQELKVFCYGKQKTDFTYVEDVAQAYERLFNSGKIGEVYNIARGVPETYEDLVKTINKFVPCKMDFLPPREGEKSFYLWTRARKLRSRGFSPRWNLEWGIEKTVEWFRERVLPG